MGCRTLTSDQRDLANILIYINIFIESAPIESVDPLPQRFRFISFCDSKLTVASIHIEGLKTCVESQKSNMARSYYVAHLQANLVDLVDEYNGSIHWFILARGVRCLLFPMESTTYRCKRVHVWWPVLIH